MHQSCPPSSRSQQHSPLAVVQQPVLATLTLQQNTRTPVLRRKPIKGLKARQITSNSLVLNMTSLPIRFTTSATADRSVGQCLQAITSCCHGYSMRCMPMVGHEWSLVILADVVQLQSTTVLPAKKPSAHLEQCWQRAQGLGPQGRCHWQASSSAGEMPWEAQT